MSNSLPVPQPSFAPDDYEAIEEAVMETARGRWFLTEYARRMRAAETANLLEAVTRIERSLRGDSPGSLSQGDMGEAVAAIEKRLSEIAWSLRERGFDGRTCAEIETQARALRQLALPGGASMPPVLAAAPVVPVAPAAPRAPVWEPVADLNARLPEVRPVAAAAERAKTMDEDEPTTRIETLIELDAIDDCRRAMLFY